MPAEERVLCFERKLLEGLGLFQGLSMEVDKYLNVVASPSNVTYLNRREAEQDKRYKQLIPYVLLISNDRVLRYQRGAGGAENRLHGLNSIGIGGHISEEDTDLFSQGTVGYYDGMRREIKEEVAIEAAEEAAVAVINDDTTDVGYVHFGVVHIMKVADEKLVGYKRGIRAPEFVAIAEAKKDMANYESWSRFCLDRIDMLLSMAGTVAAAKRHRVL